MRNFLAALPLYQELAGEDHPGLKLACVPGTSPGSSNYPQVLKGVGAEAYYTIAGGNDPDAVWVGIDGTALPCCNAIPHTRIEVTDKHPPCAECSGSGCKSCRGMGLRFVEGLDQLALKKVLIHAISTQNSAGIIDLCCQECLPDWQLLDLVDGLNQTADQVPRAVGLLQQDNPPEGLLQRLNQFLKTNLQEIFVPFENPGRLLDERTAALREEKRRVRFQLVRSRTDQKRLEQQLAENQEICSRCEERIQIALHRAEPDLQQEAEQRRDQSQATLNDLSRELQEHQARSRDLLAEVERLEEEYKRGILLKYRSGEANPGPEIGTGREFLWDTITFLFRRTGRTELEQYPGLLGETRLQGPPRKGCIRFATPVDLYTRYNTYLRAAVLQRSVLPTPPGLFASEAGTVTRIKITQRTRAAAYKLIAAEAAGANQNWAAGTPCRPPAEFSEAWRQVAFSQSYHAIYGEMIDSAYVELMEMLDRAEAAADPYLKPPGPKDHGAFTAIAEDTIEKRLGELDLKLDRAGILSVLCGGRNLFGSLSHSHARRNFRIMELVLEADAGGSQDTQGHDLRDRTQVSLGDYNQVVEAAPGAIRWIGQYTGGDPSVHRLSWTVTVTASADGQRLEFVTEIDWDTYNRRLRVVTPVAFQEDGITWEIPFGFVQHPSETIDPRFHAATHPASSPQSEVRSHSTRAIPGSAVEFPALHWVRKSVDSQAGIALLNRGLPCHCWRPGCLDIRLLSSTMNVSEVVEPSDYEFWDIDGQRDTGQHQFEYSLWPYVNGLSAGDLTRAGYKYNLPADLDVPFGVEGDVVVTAWKCAENGSGWVLRLQEAGGQDSRVTLVFKEPHSVTLTDLLERPQSASVITQQFTAPLHKHGILTLLIQAHPMV